MGEGPSVNHGAPIDNPGVLSLGLPKYVMGIHFGILCGSNLRNALFRIQHCLTNMSINVSQCAK